MIGFELFGVESKSLSFTIVLPSLQSENKMGDRLS